MDPSPQSQLGVCPREAIRSSQDRPPLPVPTEDPSTLSSLHCIVTATLSNNLLSKF